MGPILCSIQISDLDHPWTLVCFHQNDSLKAEELLATSINFLNLEWEDVSEIEMIFLENLGFQKTDFFSDFVSYFWFLAALL